MKPRLVTVDIVGLNERGYGTAKLEEQNIFVLNALPGEKVEALIVKKKMGNLFGIAKTILIQSALRLNPKEEHFTSCSPWQILPLKNENDIKEQQILELFHDQGLAITTTMYDGLDLAGYDSWQYRNKVEYSFYSDDQDLSLAYFKREGGFGKFAHTGCSLVPEPVDEIALKIVEFLKSKLILAKQLKALLLRYSFANKQVLAKLYVKDIELSFNQTELQDLFDSLENLAGLEVAYSTHKSPAAVTTQLLNSLGQNYLQETILEHQFRYLIDGFFQVNPIVFTQTALDFIQIINEIPDHQELKLVDLYAGVGVLGQLVAGQVKSVLAVESFAGIKDWALINAELNKVGNYEFIELPAEKSLESIEQGEILIIDPPRAGLSPKVVEKILEVKPQTILYLSCNPQTQARDAGLLSSQYQISFAKAYNYYPHTPHSEHLIVLSRD
jgi:23S rRNA (uracil1939-C5)-methyltransferase